MEDFCLLPDEDPMGHACLDYLSNDSADELIVECSVTDDDNIPVNYLFRDFEFMSAIEQHALQLCKGRTVDIGGGTGVHSLWLQDAGLDVTLLEHSTLLCDVARKRGVEQIINRDFFHFEGETFDTLLMMMNGIGISGTLSGLEKLLIHSRSLLNPGGQLIIDSSDIKYLYKDDDGGMWVDLNTDYYGELTYRMRYKNITGKYFNWLFIDFDLLTDYAQRYGYTCEKIMVGINDDYLAKLTLL